MEFPEGLSDQEKEQFRELLTVVKSDSTGFMHASIIEALREPSFKQRIDASLKKRAIAEAASFLSGCSESLKLTPENLQTVLRLPPSEISALASVADVLHGRQLSITPETVKDVCDQAVVMRIMEAENIKHLGDKVGELSERSDGMDQMTEAHR